MTRLLFLLLLLASLPAAAQPWPAPGDGFDWQTVGDRPVKADQIAFDTQGRLWAASGTTVGNAAKLSDPDDPAAEWSITGSIRLPYRILALGRGDTVLVSESITHRTLDGGVSWSTVDNSCGTRGGLLVEVPFGTPAGAWGAPSGMLLAGEIGLCRSDDRGTTWTEVPVSNPPFDWFLPA